MRQTRLIMGMPIEIDIVSDDAAQTLDDAFAYLTSVDERFSTYKAESEISRINRGEIETSAHSDEMKEVFALAEKTKKETKGYFDIRRPDGSVDPSGIVKGWAIHNAAKVIEDAGHEHFFINAGGDIAMSGKNEKGEEWSVGIRNPFNSAEIVKVVYPKGKGVATSGSYVRGAHIYNPHSPADKLSDVVSITIIGPDVLEADRFATAAFAMGKSGIDFIETIPGLEGYMIDTSGVATFTSGFAAYTQK
jgi:thiamine biosynthesis lipoprotein